MSAWSARLTVPRSDLLAPEAEPGVLISKRLFSLVTGITGALRWRAGRLSGGVDCGPGMSTLGVLLLAPTHVLLLRAAHSEVKFLVPEGLLPPPEGTGSARLTLTIESVSANGNVGNFGSVSGSTCGASGETLLARVAESELFFPALKLY
jgi:hypothetical protein